MVHAHIGQYEKCSMVELFIANIRANEILVIGHVFRYIGSCVVGQANAMMEPL